jgi:hypothetical protein
MYTIKAAASLKQVNVASTDIDVQQYLSQHSFLASTLSDFTMRYLPEVSGEVAERAFNNRSLMEWYSKQYRSSINDLNTQKTKEASFSDNVDGINFSFDQFADTKTAVGTYTERIELEQEVAKAEEAGKTPKTSTLMKLDALNRKARQQAHIDGRMVANNYYDYWTSKAKNEYYLYDSNNLETKSVSVVLPVTLTLTIYGISGLQPGDLFRVNYLPETHLENVFFQIMKVTQNITTSEWSTTIEAQMKLRPSKGDLGEMQKPYTVIHI